MNDKQTPSTSNGGGKTAGGDFSNREIETNFIDTSKSLFTLGNNTPFVFDSTNFGNRSGNLDPFPGSIPLNDPERHNVDVWTRYKLPDFVRTDPRLWFTQIEFMLNASRITAQRTRAAAVVAALHFEAIQAINDIISVEVLAVKFWLPEGRKFWRSTIPYFE